MHNVKKGIAVGLIALSVSLPASAAGELKKRSEMDARTQWKLSDIYRTATAWEQDWQAAKKLGGSLKKYEGKLNQPASLYEFMKAYETVSIKLDKLIQYSNMGSDQDTSVASFNELVGKADTLAKEIAAQTAFFSPEISKLSEKQLASMIKRNPKLAPYKMTLSDTIRRAKHTLPKEQETLLAQSGEVMGTAENVFKMLNNADLSFPTIQDEDGNPVELTKGRYIAFQDSEDRGVRKAAWEGLHATYRKFNNTLGSLYNSHVKMHVFGRTVRKYPSSLTSALDGENIPVSVYTNLISAVNKGLPALHKYYAVRKRILDLDNLYPYDTSVALLPGFNLTYTYDQANEVIKQGLAPLGKEYLKIYDQGLKAGWVDVYENKGKRSGAYSWGPYSVHPYVLHNWSDTYWGMSTMAHEMGHAIHRYYSQGANNYFNADNPIFVAEVASQTNEILLLEHQLKLAKDKKERLFLLTQYANGIIGSIYRQTQYAEFEKATHDLGDKGETLTSESLNKLWKGLLAKYGGKALSLPADAEVGWSRVPHFYYNFYVYKYSTSYAASVAMAEKILKEGTPAANRYVAFLKTGSSKYPVDQLKEAGVDLTTSKPVEVALKKFAQIVDEIDRLSKELQG